MVSRPGGSSASDILKCDKFSHPSDARHRRWHQRTFSPGDSQQPRRGLIGISLKECAGCVNGVRCCCGLWQSVFFLGFVVARIYCNGSNVIFLPSLNDPGLGARYWLALHNRAEPRHCAQCISNSYSRSVAAYFFN